MKNYQAILIAVVGIGMAILTGNGTIQNYIGFAGDLNEMAFTVVGMMLGMMGLAAIDYRKLLKGLL
jgi:hypothetical protein